LLVTLDVAVRVRVVTATLRMQQGNFSAAKGVGTGVYELRLDTGPVYRIYFGKDGDALVILLGGGSKKRQSVDIQRALACWAEYKRSKQEG
jgi:putative addiction module killer protein